MTNLSKYTEELFRDMYWKELDRRDRINSSLSLPAGFVSQFIFFLHGLSFNF
jgi:hypothetical protein